MNILIHHASFQQAEGLSYYIIKYIYIFMCVWYNIYIYTHVYTYVYVCVCVSILWQHKFFSKWYLRGRSLICPKKRESLEKINLIIDVGNLGQNLSTSMQKKGRTTLRKRGDFHRKN